jgi:hypothetical protein
LELMGLQICDGLRMPGAETYDLRICDLGEPLLKHPKATCNLCVMAPRRETSIEISKKIELKYRKLLKILESGGPATPSTTKVQP